MSETFCARVLCAEPASAAMLINARELSAHVVDIHEEASITGVPLCGAHADGVVVPSGWTQQDMRSPVVVADREPELVLLDDARSGRSEEELILFDDARSDRSEVEEEGAAEYGPDHRRSKRSEAEEELEEAAGGEIPPLLSRAFRAAGLD